jgi:hypothetical protein
VDGPVGAGVMYSRMLEKAECRRFIWLNMSALCCVAMREVD